MSLKVVITDCSWSTIDIERKYLPQDANVEGYQCENENEVIRVCKDADAILSEYAPLSEEVLRSLSRCKIISNTAIGVDNINIKVAKELGIAVANVPGYCASEVADHSMALILASNRNIVKYNKAVKNNIWDIDCVPPMKRLNGQVLGLVGFGEIAQCVAIRAQSFGMRVIIHSSVPEELVNSFNVKRVDLNYLLRESDIISCHLPLNDKTIGFFDETKFKKMKKKPIFINTSRGKVVNEKDLIDALEKNVICGAALDVLKEEPPLPSNKLLRMENVILTPHVAFYSEESIREVRRRSALNVKNFFEKNYENVHFVNDIFTK